MQWPFNKPTFERFSKTFGLQYLAILLIGITSFLLFYIFYQQVSANDYFKEIVAALMSTLLTAVITTMLLKGQTQHEELKENDVEFFKQKLAAHQEFVSFTTKVMMDSELSVSELEPLKMMLFKLALFSSDETINLVSRYIKDQLYNVNEDSIQIGALVNEFRKDLRRKPAGPLSHDTLDKLDILLSRNADDIKRQGELSWEFRDLIVDIEKSIKIYYFKIFQQLENTAPLESLYLPFDSTEFDIQYGFSLIPFGKSNDPSGLTQFLFKIQYPEDFSVNGDDLRLSLYVVIDEFEAQLREPLFSFLMSRKFIHATSDLHVPADKKIAAKEFYINYSLADSGLPNIEWQKTKRRLLSDIQAIVRECRVILRD